MKAREHAIPLFELYLDYSKAFDTVNHGHLWNILEDMGFPPHTIHLISQLYDTQECRVRLNCGLSDWFAPERGVRQGCTNSPDLFNLYTEHVMRTATGKFSSGFNIGGRQISDLRYADDTALLTTSAQEMQLWLNAVNEAGKEYDLQLNVKKTKHMRSNTNDQQAITANDENIEEVNQFVYLGVQLNNNGDRRVEIKRRIGLAKTAITKCDYIWKSSDVSLNSKLSLIKAIGTSVMTYGCEAWVCEPNRNQIEAFEMWYLRRTLGITWKDRKTNNYVLEKSGQKREIYPQIAARKLRYFGHTIRHNSLEKDTMLGMVPNQRKRGRPAARWIDDILHWTGAANVGQATRWAEDRHHWRNLVHRTVSRLKSGSHDRHND